MLYNLSNEYQREQCIARFKTLLDKGVVVNLTERCVRTPSQNRYLHLIIGVMAMETGTSLDYAKEWYFKRIANKDLFVREVNDELIGRVEMLRSSRDLSKEEMSMAIDRFKKWASEQGIYLPNPEDLTLLQQVEVELGRMGRYL